MSGLTTIRRDGILLVDFAPALRGEADFTRPTVVVTNNVANVHSPATLAVPLTHNGERVYPFELLSSVECSGLDRDRKAQPQFVRHVSAARVNRVLGHLQEDLMGGWTRGCERHLGLG